MKFEKVLEEIFGKKSSISILRVLSEKGIGLTGRQTAELSGLNHRTCQLALKKLHTEGIVTLKRVGKANLYTLKKDHVLVKNSILPLFEIEKNLLNKVLSEITKELRANVLSLILFGSHARMKGSADSDLDICVVVSSQKGKTIVDKKSEILSQKVMQLCGNNLSLYVKSDKEIKRKYLEENPLIKEIVSEGKVFYGKKLEEIL